MPVSFHVVRRHRRSGEHQCLPALASGVADGVHEELEVLLAEFGCRPPVKRSEYAGDAERQSDVFKLMSAGLRCSQSLTTPRREKQH